MDPEIRRALENIKRRKQEIRRKYGSDHEQDDGPIFHRERRKEFDQTMDEFAEFDDE